MSPQFTSKQRSRNLFVRIGKEELLQPECNNIILQTNLQVFTFTLSTDLRGRPKVCSERHVDRDQDVWHCTSQTDSWNI